MLALYVDLGDMPLLLLEVSLGWLSLSLASILLSDILKAWRWQWLLAPLKEHVKLSNAWSISILGSFVNTLLPIRVGEVSVRALLMRQRESIEFFGSVSSVVVEKVLDMLVIAAFATAMLFALPIELGDLSWIPNALGGLGVLALVALAAIIIGARRHEPLLRLERRAIQRLPLSARWRSRLERLFEQVIYGAQGLSRRPSATALLFAQTGGVWLFNALSVYFIFLAFSLEASFIPIILGSMLLFATYIAPQPPGYVGSFEAFWSAIFLGLGFAATATLPIAVIYHLVTVLLIVAEGYLATVILGLTFKRVIREAAAHEEKDTAYLGEGAP